MIYFLCDGEHLLFRGAANPCNCHKGKGFCCLLATPVPSGWSENREMDHWELMVARFQAMS